MRTIGTSSVFSLELLRDAVVLGLLFISADLAHAQGRLPDCFVLSVGVDNYTNVGKLKGDVNDARNTTAAFTAQQSRIEPESRWPVLYP